MSDATSTDERGLRIRSVLDAQFVLILLVCLLVAAAGVGLIYATHIEPGTETETQTVAEFSTDSGYEHSAVVTEPNEVFDTGTVLDDRETYFTRISPELDILVATEYLSTDASDMEITLDSVLVIRNADEGEVFWDDEERLATEQSTGVENGDPVAAEYTINISELDERVSELENEVGSSPGATETVIETTVIMEGTLAGESLSHSRTVALDIDIAGDTYTVSELDDRTDSADRTEQVTVERTHGPFRSAVGPVLLILGAISSGWLLYARQQNKLALTQTEQAYLSYRNDRSEFDEWITKIRLPQSVHERETATAESLKELVDFAIDNNTGVIDDPETDAFYAVTDTVVYTYRPPPKPDAD